MTKKVYDSNSLKILHKMIKDKKIMVNINPNIDIDFGQTVNKKRMEAEGTYMDRAQNPILASNKNIQTRHNSHIHNNSKDLNKVILNDITANLTRRAKENAYKRPNNKGSIFYRDK